MHSDSQGALAGIRAYLHECNTRRRLRTAARPLLQLIAHLLAVRERAGGAVHWHHVKAHTQGADIDSVGNRLTDWQANRARVQPKVPQPLQLRELPLGACEPFLTVYQQPNTVRECQLIDDPRRCALAYLKATALSTWCARREAPEKVTQDGTLAGADMLDLSRIVLAAGSPAQQATLIHVATNSIQCAWVETADNPKPHVVALLCPNCVGFFFLNRRQLHPQDYATRATKCLSHRARRRV